MKNVILSFFNIKNRNRNKHASISVVNSLQAGTEIKEMKQRLSAKISIESLAIIVLLVAIVGGVPIFATNTSFDASGGQNASDPNTWEYDISIDPSQDPSSVAGISHISLQTCFSEEELDGGVLLSTVPSGAQTGKDGSTGYEDVIKWNTSFPDLTTVSITLDKDYVGDADGEALVIIKYGNNVDTITVPGPDCDSTPDPDPATLTIIKNVVNDDGTLSNTASDFTIEVIGTNVSSPSFAGSASGTVVTLDAGSYSVDEADSLGYIRSLSPDCSGTIGAGESKTCTITNDDPDADAATLTLEKTVINDNGGTALASDFQAYVDGNTIGWSDPQTFAAGSYTASEDNLAGYTATSWGGDCNADGTIVLSAGQDAVCTITNIYDPPDPTPPPPPSNPSSPNLTIDKTVNVDITDPDTVITYTIVVTNTGNASANNVLLEDVLPGGFTYVDTGTDTRSWNLGNMFPGDTETRIYDVHVGADVEPGIYVNTAVVSATNHGQRSDTASVRVRGVLGETAEPILDIEKIGDKAFVNPGGQITYTVAITNVGEAAAIDLVVTDTLPNGFTLAENGETTVSWTVPTLQVGDTWTTSFLVNVSDAAALGQHVNIVKANADNYATELFASYTVEIRKGGVLGDTGASPWVFVSMIIGTLMFLVGIAGVMREYRSQNLQKMKK